MLALAEEILEEHVERYAGKDQDLEEWDIPALIREVSRIFGIDPAELEKLELETKSSDEIGDGIWALAKKSYEEKEALVSAELLRRVERDIMLQIVDAQWKDHLRDLDHLKEGIGLRGYGQRDPLVEYKKESFALFEGMRGRIEEEIVRYLFWLRPVLNEEAPVPRPAPRRPQQITMSKPEAEAAVPAFAGGGRASSAAATLPAPARQAPVPARTGGDDVIKTVKHDQPKVGRNDPCPCGSGKKYKKCHGAAA
jgi:preprotein translocase subunit SecA